MTEHFEDLDQSWSLGQSGNADEVNETPVAANEPHDLLPVLQGASQEASKEILQTLTKHLCIDEREVPNCR